MLKLKPAALATLALLSSLAVAQTADRKTYIVQLKDEPAVTYGGGIKDLAATAPAAGQPFRFARPEVAAYLAYLDTAQNAVVAAVGNAPVLAKYTNVFNGFAASLTESQALLLANNPNVAGIWEDEARKLDTISTAKFLKLSESGGLWSQTAGGSAIKGENMVVGIIDGGIWPENPAFFDRVDGTGKPSNNPADTQVYGPAPATFTGTCAAAPGINPALHCNNKLLSIRHFNTGFNASGQTLHWTDFANSGRDSVAGATGHGGHGDHTASTAAGNANVPVIMNGASIGTAAGMAPRARIASYKVCWTYVNAAATDGTGSQNSCYNSDSVAAIDQAVADGVNVINYSISGSQTSVNDAVEQAFHRAALAGVFVAASAGNSGPGNAVAHISPWLTTVAASTHDRAFAGSATLGNGASYSGGSTTQTGLPSTNMILAENAGVGGGDASLCFSAAPPSGQVLLDPAKVAGKLVVCTRGTNARVDKGDAVKNAGGAGMILVNAAAGQTIDADFQSVPTVQVSNTDGAAIKAYVSGTAGATGTIAVSTLTSKPAPIMAGFSSRGPNQGDGNILKPDLTAPGVDVIAQVTPGLTEAERNAVAAGTLVPPPAWASYQGTSMSSPHVAGLALLLKQAHPTWSPSAIKSALMTSAYSTLDDGVAGASNGLLPWSQGAGHVDPQKANNPGLVYDSGANDWIKYQCKVNRAAVSPSTLCTTVGTFTESYELNLASMTASTILGSVTFPRTVTNVSGAAATFTAVANVPGFTTVVTPSTLSLAAGATGSFTVKLTANGAAEGVWQFGELVWTGAGTTVRSPIQARIGKPIVAPAEFTGTTTSGSRLMTVKTGFSGRMTARAGIKPVTVSAETTLAADSGVNVLAVCRAGVDTANVKVYNFTVPAGAIVARWAIRTADVSTSNDDNDIMVLNAAGTQLAYPGLVNSQESFQIASPAAGNYRVCVHAYGGTAPMKHKLSSWIVSPGEGAANLRAMLPSAVYAGSSASVGMSWAGLATGGRYVGGVQLLDLAPTVQATTVLRVSNDGVVPVSSEPTAPAKKPVMAN